MPLPKYFSRRETPEMGDECGIKMVKYMIFTINFLICLFGGAVMGVGIATNLSSDFMSKLQDLIDTYQPGDHVKLSSLTTPIWCLVGVGAFLLLTGLIGCCGAACGNRCFLGLFIVIISIIFIAQLGTGIAAYFLRGTAKDKIKEVIEDVYKGYKKLAKDANRSDHSLIKFEKEFKCCGIQGKPGTWGDEDETKDHCPKPKTGPGYDNCVDVFWNRVKKLAVPAAVAAGVVLVIELLAIICSCVICNAGSQKSSYQGYT